MSDKNLPVEVPRTSLQVMASRLSIDPAEMEGIVMKTLVSAKNNGQVSNEEFVTYMAIANEYQLNPLTKEIYAFANRGAIQPIVSIDGWLKIINSNPQFDGMEFDDLFEDGGDLSAVTCRIYRKDRSRPVSVTEYMAECAGTSEPWKRWPARMLRHKATIQAARYAFGLSGIVDPDEADRIKSVDQPRQAERDVTPSSELSACIDETQITELLKIIGMAGMTAVDFCEHKKVNVSSLTSFPAARFEGAKKWLSNMITATTETSE